jgi:hypothetical protein
VVTGHKRGKLKAGKELGMASRDLRSCLCSRSVYRIKAKAAKLVELKRDQGIAPADPALPIAEGFAFAGWPRPPVELKGIEPSTS